MGALIQRFQEKRLVETSGMGARVETQLPFDPLSVTDEDHGPTDKDGELLAKKSRLDGPIKFNISKNLGAQFKRLLYNGVEKRKAKEIVGWGGGIFRTFFTKICCQKTWLFQL
jgi:hypothetical protein